MTLPSNLYDSLCHAVEKVVICLEQEKQIINKFDFNSISSIVTTKRAVMENYRTVFTNFLGEEQSKSLPQEKKLALKLLIQDLQIKMIENQQLLDKAIRLNQKMMQLFLRLTKQIHPYTSNGVISKNRKLSKAVAIDEKL